ncbi:hypothetical protein HDU93_005955, partial [Gonapodya sp. JEL0774]
ATPPPQLLIPFSAPEDSPVDTCVSSQASIASDPTTPTTAKQGSSDSSPRLSDQASATESKMSVGTGNSGSTITRASALSKEDIDFSETQVPTITATPPTRTFEVIPGSFRSSLAGLLGFGKNLKKMHQDAEVNTMGRYVSIYEETGYESKVVGPGGRPAAPVGSGKSDRTSPHAGNASPGITRNGTVYQTSRPAFPSSLARGHLVPSLERPISMISTTTSISSASTGASSAYPTSIPSATDVLHYHLLGDLHTVYLDWKSSETATGREIVGELFASDGWAVQRGWEFRQ